MTHITIWSRWNNKTKEFDHNHIEDGWVETDTPMPKSDLQKASWKDATWQRTYGTLESRVVNENYE